MHTNKLNNLPLLKSGGVAKMGVGRYIRVHVCGLNMVFIVMIISLATSADQGVRVPRSSSVTVLPLQLSSGNFHTQIVSKGATLTVTTDTGSSNLAIPTTACSLCQGGTASTCANGAPLYSQCYFGEFFTPCGCDEAVDLNDLDPLELVACDSTAIDWDYCAGFGFNVANEPWNNSISFSSCQCVLGKDAAPEVASLASTHVVVSGTGYGDCSGFLGLVANIPVSLGTQSTSVFATLMNFMATNHMACESAQSAVQNQGIMGLAYQSLNSMRVPTPFESLVQSGQVTDVLTFCAIPWGEMKTQTAGGAGVLVFGDAIAELPWLQASFETQWTPITAEYYYNVHVLDVLLNGQSIGESNLTLNANGGPILDSGTSTLVLPANVYDAITAWLPMSVVPEALPFLPSVSIVMGVTSCVSLTNYRPGVYCGSQDIMTAYVANDDHGGLFQLARKPTPTGYIWALLDSSGTILLYTFFNTTDDVDAGVSLSGTQQFINAHNNNTVSLEFVQHATPTTDKSIAIELKPEHLYICCGPDYAIRDAYACSGAEGPLAYTNLCSLWIESGAGIVLGHPMFWPQTVTIDRANKRIGFSQKGSCTTTPPPATTTTSSITTSPNPISHSSNKPSYAGDGFIIAVCVLGVIVLVGLIVVVISKCSSVSSSSSAHQPLSSKLIDGDGNDDHSTSYIEMNNVR